MSEETIDPELEERLAQAAENLPAVPNVLMLLLQSLHDKDVSVKKLERIILMDLVMTAKILKLSNSAYYGLPRRIGTVSEAIMTLGFRTVRSIALSASAYNILSTELPGHRMGNQVLWRHSLLTAMTAREMAKQVSPAVVEQAFICGLLHDIGRMLIDREMGQAYSRIEEIKANQKIKSVAAEEKVLGYDHTLAGYLVLRKWNLPLVIQEAVRFHHRPSSAPEESGLVKIIHMADCAAHHALEETPELFRNVIDERVLRSLESDGLSREQLLNMAKENIAAMKELTSGLN